MEQITCDLIPGGKMPLLHASQYDEGREYRINLTENKQAYTLDGTELLTVSVRKGDNTLFTADIANTFGGKSYVDFVSTEQMCACAGYNFGELTIEKNNTRIGTVNFMLVCEPSPEADFPSDSEIKNLNRCIDDYLDETLPDVLDDDVPPIVERVIDETLAPVAKSGNYNDLSNKPTIPAPQVNSDWNANSGVSKILNKPSLSKVATTGNYDDLNNKPSVAVIDDTQASASKVYSSNKVDNLITAFLKNEAGKNFYTGLNEVHGYLNANGTIHSSTQDWETTDFIKVEGMDYITCSAFVVSENKRAKINMYFMCTYDSSKTIIGQDSSNPKTYEVQSGVSYIRFSYRSSIYTNFQVENNNEMTGYEPFTIYNLLKNTLAVDWSDKLWCCVGDSLTEINKRTDKHYFDYISEKTNIKIFNMGVGGTGYLRGQDTNIAFYQRISSIPLDSDIITIFGSLNDIGSGAVLGTKDDTGTSTIGGCINTTLDNLFAAFPLANVGIVTPTPWDAGQYNPITEPNNSSNYVDLLIAICKKRSIPCLDLYHCSLLRPWDADFRQLAYSKDDGNGVHPNEIGHKLIAPRFEAFLNSLLLG